MRDRLQPLALGRVREHDLAQPGAVVEVALPPEYPELPIGAPVYCSSSQAVKQKYHFDRPKAGEFRTRRPLAVEVALTHEKVIATGNVLTRPEGPALEVRREALGPFTPARDLVTMATATAEAFTRLGSTRLELESFTIRNIDNCNFELPHFYLPEIRDQVVSRVREAAPNAKVVLGGAAVNVSPRDVLRFLEADLAVVGEGEEAFPNLLSSLERRGAKFRTHSDTETILQGFAVWGNDTWGKLDGMFAVAIWDHAERTLTLARDPLGIKPFYYAVTDRFFAFASESQALAALTGGGLDEDAVGAYLLCRYVPGTWSIFRDVRKLAPGESLTVTASNLQSLASPTTADSLDSPDSLDSLDF